MMRLLCGFAVALGAGIAAAQGGYDAIRLENAGLVSGNLNGQLSEISGGVSIVLLSEDTGQPEVPVRANKITFEYAEGASMPSRIKLSGSVYIKHPTGEMTAGSAEWNFETGEMVFTGSPKLKSPQVREMTADTMRINVETGKFSAEGSVRVLETQLGGGAAAAGAVPAASQDASLLTADSFTDLRKFANEMKKAAAPDAPNSPGKHVVALLGEQGRAMLAADAQQLATRHQDKVIGGLNALLKSEAFYSEAAWEGIAIPEEASALLDKGERTASETTRMNRLLLSAAYPDLVKRP